MIKLLRKWLGIVALEKEVLQLRTKILDLQQQLSKVDVVALDISYTKHDETQIIIASRLGKGYVKIIDTRLESMAEVQRLVRDLENRYIPKSRYIDAPVALRHWYQNH